jgi:hypothetical protein
MREVIVLPSWTDTETVTTKDDKQSHENDSEGLECIAYPRISRNSCDDRDPTEKEDEWDDEWVKPRRKQLSRMMQRLRSFFPHRRKNRIGNMKKCNITSMVEKVGAGDEYQQPSLAGTDSTAGITNESSPVSMTSSTAACVADNGADNHDEIGDWWGQSHHRMEFDLPDEFHTQEHNHVGDERYTNTSIERNDENVYEEELLNILDYFEQIIITQPLQTLTDNVEVSLVSVTQKLEAIQDTSKYREELPLMARRLLATGLVTMDDFEFVPDYVSNEISNNFNGSSLVTCGHHGNNGISCNKSQIAHVKTGVWEVVHETGGENPIENDNDSNNNKEERFFVVTAVAMEDRVDTKKLRQAVFGKGAGNGQPTRCKPKLNMAPTPLAEGLVGFKSGTMAPICHTQRMALFIEESLLRDVDVNQQNDEDGVGNDKRIIIECGSGMFIDFCTRLHESCTNDQRRCYGCTLDTEEKEEERRIEFIVKLHIIV